MNIKVEKPILVCISKSGKELYLNPRTNVLCSREMAFADYEGLKSEAQNKVYIDELRQVNLKSDQTPNVILIDEPGGVNIYGEIALKPQIENDLNRIDILLNELEATLNCHKKPKEQQIEVLPFLPYLHHLSRKFIRFFYNKEEYLTEEEDIESGLNSDSNSNSSSNSRHKKHRFRLFA